jgi:hypothetical protein
MKFSPGGPQQPHSPAAGTLTSQAANAFLPQRMDQLRGNLGKRDQHEQSFVQARMWNLQVIIRDHLRIVHEQIDVQGPRYPLALAHPAEVVFNLVTGGQELMWGKRRSDRQNGIQKIGTVLRAALRIGLVNSGGGFEHNSWPGAEGVSAAAHECEAIPEVAAESQICQSHVRNNPKPESKLFRSRPPQPAENAVMMAASQGWCLQCPRI